MHESKPTIYPIITTEGTASATPMGELTPLTAGGSPFALNETTTLAVMPTEAIPVTPESADPVRMQKLHGGLGGLSLEFLRPKIDKAQLAVNGIRRSLGETRVAREEKAQEALETTAEVHKTVAESARTQRGTPADKAPVTIWEQLQESRAWSRKAKNVKHASRINSLSKTYGKKSPKTGGNTYYGVEVTPSLRKWYGMPVDTEDPYRRVLPPKEAEIAVTKKGAATIYTPHGGENDLGTQAYFDRTKGRRLTPRDRRAAVKAGKEGAELIHHTEHTRHKLRKSAAGKDIPGRFIASERRKADSRVDAGYDKLDDLQTQRRKIEQRIADRAAKKRAARTPAVRPVASTPRPRGPEATTDPRLDNRSVEERLAAARAARARRTT